MGAEMELRHLRYFVSVADAGSLTLAAEQSLHTSQPSLSRQIRDLEDEVGTPLLTRRARGIELTPRVELSLSTPAWCYRRWKRPPKLPAGPLTPLSHASLWAF